ncbi:hypothetical protein J8273_2711 [Carpediemonas membranifera]|uniref:Uncharacterized protein n=1 Tax=Carpediemonas membranifera TaxID=201153 RepID=A0A8J6E122_9EUKA|nr:hypothetical protein J8273_2711 [Carpediemonas membranifera]|eukprot:KAG9395799.1 hypothetical protein J8273_2711 [Carpediemonas membranifera]
MIASYEHIIVIKNKLSVLDPTESFPALSQSEKCVHLLGNIFQEHNGTILSLDPELTDTDEPVEVAECGHCCSMTACVSCSVCGRHTCLACASSCSCCMDVCCPHCSTAGVCHDCSD